MWVVLMLYLTSTLHMEVLELPHDGQSEREKYMERPEEPNPRCMVLDMSNLPFPWLLFSTTCGLACMGGGGGKGGNPAR